MTAPTVNFEMTLAYLRSAATEAARIEHGIAPVSDKDSVVGQIVRIGCVRLINEILKYAETVPEQSGPQVIVEDEDEEEKYTFRPEG